MRNRIKEILEESEFGWTDEIGANDFHIGTEFRYFGGEYDENSEVTYKILSIDPLGSVGTESSEGRKLPIDYGKMKSAFDAGIYENVSVRDTIDSFIGVGNKFIIEEAWWEGERDGIRHPKEEGELVLQITNVNEFGDCNYVVVESELPIGEPVGSEDDIEINRLRTFIKTDWWKPYNN